MRDIGSTPIGPIIVISLPYHLVKGKQQMTNLTNITSIEQITPHLAVKIAESHSGFSPKERAKMLALALMRICKSSIEVKIMWEFSQFVASDYGFEIPNFDPKFIVDINENPKAFVDYK